MSVPLCVVFLALGVSIKTTRRPPRSKGSTTGAVFVQYCNPLLCNCSNALAGPTDEVNEWSHKDPKEGSVRPASNVGRRRRLETTVQESSEDDLDENGSGVESGGGGLKEKR